MGEWLVGMGEWLIEMSKWLIGKGEWLMERGGVGRRRRTVPRTVSWGPSRGWWLFRAGSPFMVSRGSPSRVRPSAQQAPPCGYFTVEDEAPVEFSERWTFPSAIARWGGGRRPFHCKAVNVTRMLLVIETLLLIILQTARCKF